MPIRVSRARWLSALCLTLPLSFWLSPRPAAAEATMTPRQGGHALPLVDEKVDVAIDHQVARIRLEHVFENPNGFRVEGHYRVALGPHANVSDFSYWNGSEEIVGEVIENAVAAELFMSVARIRQRDPGLLQRDSDDAFSLRIFPIFPQEKKRIVIHAEQWLPRQGDTVSLRIPMSLDDTAVSIDLQDPRAIGAITSPTHELSIDTSSGHPVITTTGAGERELLHLDYRVTVDPWSLTATHHRDPGQPAFVLLTAQGEDGAASEPRDLTLVLDRSGSVANDFEAMRRFAHGVVDELGPDDRLNLVGYSDWAQSLYREARPATAEVKREAHHWLDQQGAYHIGSNFAAAWSVARRTIHRSGNPDALLWLSDGESGSVRRAYEELGGDDDRIRIYPLAVGDAVDRRPFEALGEHHGAALGHLDDTDVATTMAALRQPHLEEVALKVTGGTLLAEPEIIPDVRAGGDFRLLAKVDGSGPVTLELTGELGGKPKSLTTTVDLSAPTSRPWLGRQWAQQRIDELAHRDAERLNRNPFRCSCFRTAATPTEVKDEITELGMAYDIVTRYTSFLAIPESELGASGKESLEAARARKRDYLTEHPEAVGLSRNHMPPGDPILHVEAPRDAQAVTATFPFGLVEDLTWSEKDGEWRVRFLVPSDVPDGMYDVVIDVVERDGTVVTTTVPYAIDSTVDPFELEEEAIAGATRVRLRAEEGLFEVRLVTSTGVVAMRGGPDGRLWQAEIPSGVVVERVVAADLAGNESVKEVTP